MLSTRQYAQPLQTPVRGNTNQQLQLGNEAPRARPAAPLDPRGLVPVNRVQPAPGDGGQAQRLMEQRMNTMPPADFNPIREGGALPPQQAAPVQLSNEGRAAIQRTQQYGVPRPLEVATTNQLNAAQRARAMRPLSRTPGEAEELARQQMFLQARGFVPNVPPGLEAARPPGAGFAPQPVDRMAFLQRELGNRQQPIGLLAQEQRPLARPPQDYLQNRTY